MRGNYSERLDGEFDDVLFNFFGGLTGFIRQLNGIVDFAVGTNRDGIAAGGVH